MRSDVEKQQVHGAADVSISLDESLPLSGASHEDIVKQAEARAEIKDVSSSSSTSDNTEQAKPIEVR